MSKPVLLLMAPVTTVSGYGARSRDIATALIKSDKYDVKIWPTRWGSTPMNALSENNPKHKAIYDRLLSEPKLNQQPEIFVQITVPNEFQKMGKYNIGITAGIETTIASAPWIEGCNRMDLVLTSSEHSKKVLESSVWAQVDNNTKQQVGELKLTTPIEVLFEGVDLETYCKTSNINKTVVDQLKQVKEDFAFLFVGHWLNGDIGEDRKNVGMLIRTFFEAFKGKASHNQPALILKTSHADFSPLDKQDLIKKVDAIYKSVNTTKQLPNVYLLHGDLTDEEMNSLYNHPKIKAHITLTKGEGYGRPLAEAGLSHKPIIAPNWSGYLDFLKHGVLLPGQLTNVHPSAAWDQVILQESQWMTVDYGMAAGMMKSMVEDYKNYIDGARKQSTVIKKEFSFDSMCEKLQQILDTKVPEFPKQVQLKLPQLKKIELPKLQKV
jgi:glycosyltransferase involved in cell wall biosynthesis